MDSEISSLVMAQAPPSDSYISEETQKALGQAVYSSLRAIIKAVTSVSNRIVTRELSKAMRSRIAKE